MDALETIIKFCELSLHKATLFIQVYFLATVHLIVHPIEGTVSFVRKRNFSHAVEFYLFNVLFVYVINIPLMQKAGVKWLSIESLGISTIESLVNVAIVAMVFVLCERAMAVRIDPVLTCKAVLYTYSIAYYVIFPLILFSLIFTQSFELKYSPISPPHYLFLFGYSFTPLLYFLGIHGAFEDFTGNKAIFGIIALGFFYYYCVFFTTSIFYRLSKRVSYMRAFMFIFIASIILFFAFDVIMLVRAPIDAQIWKVDFDPNRQSPAKWVISFLRKEALGR